MSRIENIKVYLISPAGIVIDFKDSVWTPTWVTGCGRTFDQENSLYPLRFHPIHIRVPVANIAYTEEIENVTK